MFDAHFTDDGQGLQLRGRRDTEIGFADIYVVPVSDGGTENRDAEDGLRALTSTLDGNPLAVVNAGEGRVVIGARHGGAVHPVLLHEQDPRPHRLVDDPRIDVVSLGRVSPAGLMPVVYRTPHSYGRIGLVDTRRGGLSDIDEAPGDLGKTETLYEPRIWTMRDGHRVHGWLLHAGCGANPRRLLVDVHVGPHQAWSGTAEEAYAYHRTLVGQGWTILLVNARGSDGYGEEFMRDVRGAWGGPDAEDVLEVVDQLIDEGVVDHERIAVGGYSYGGFLACELVSRSQRFAAAVAGAAPCDLVAALSSNPEGRWVARAEFGVSVEDDPAFYERLSPLTRVEDVRTPTLLYVGDEDLVAPRAPMVEWVSRLQARGVPSRLDTLPGADHDLIFTGRPSQRNAVNTAIVDWLNQHVAGDKVDESH
ncbi:alpha/beta hydrolase family protein [Microbacterium sp. NIBRBAC000506063]|uniref:alpha/beta hydrolase family protein n=1 Tax=Microbacterium sp. NIBRBAC000506063 TaxID=2734618 RepID=UPI001BB6B3AE|nr:prolyl oligopeptidase family serine peptidase [Microbacterium sp. NIBRBAC000506063]QTV79593.1 S9 family peptidase [Microbacterium sp. NIBRBAC000506063]